MFLIELSAKEFQLAKNQILDLHSEHKESLANMGNALKNLAKAAPGGEQLLRNL